MRALKSIVRWFFALQAAILLLEPVAAIFSITKQHLANSSHITPVHGFSAASKPLGYGLFAAMFAVGVLFAMAWWTTRKFSSTRSLWAIAASAAVVGEGILLFWASHFTATAHARISPRDGLCLIALGATGIFLFSSAKTVSDPSTSDVRRAPVAGDRTNPLVAHAVTALSFVAQIAAIVIWAHWAYSHHLFRTRGITWLALITLASVLTTIIHECGHVLIAWCFQMGVISFKAGPFQWRKQEGKWQFKFHPAGLLTPGGAVGAVPTDPAQPRWEEVLLIIAGPLANLVVGLPAVYAVLHDYWSSYQQTWEFVAFTGSFCLIGGVLNLFPLMTEDGAYSDGARLLQILTKSPLDDYHRTMGSIAATVITPRRYRDQDIEAIKRAASLFPHEFRGLNLNLCACHFFEDSNRLPEAAAALASAEAIYNNFSIDLPGPLHTVFVIGHAYLNRDAAAARLWWTRMETKEDKRRSADYWLAKAALHWIEGSPKEADEAWREADAEASKLPQFGAYEFDRFRCALLRQTFEGPETLRNALRVSAPVPSPTLVPTPIPAPAVSTLIPARPVPAAARSAESNFPDVGGISDALARILAPPARVAPAEAITPDTTVTPIALSQLAPPPVAHHPDELAAPEAAVISETSTQFVPPQVAARFGGVLSPEITGMPDVPDQAFPVTASVSLLVPPDPIVPLPEDSVAIPSAVPLPGVAPMRLSISATQILAATPEVAKRAGISWDTAPPAPPAVAARTAFTPTPSSARTTFTPAPVTPPSKGPAVPAAFARRPRTVGPPLSNPFDVPVAEDISATMPPADLVTVAAPPPVEASVAPVPTASVIVESTLVAPPPVVQTQPVAEDNGRFDPLAFIRAAAMENIST